jgi:hypothetical protein
MEGALNALDAAFSQQRCKNVEGVMMCEPDQDGVSRRAVTAMLMTYTIQTKAEAAQAWWSYRTTPTVSNQSICLLKIIVAVKHDESGSHPHSTQ